MKKPRSTLRGISMCILDVSSENEEKGGQGINSCSFKSILNVCRKESLRKHNKIINLDRFHSLVIFTQHAKRRIFLII
jgi:hypothetical protein